MAGMICKCGQHLSNSSVPSGVNLIVYSEEEWDNILDCENIQPWLIPHPRYEVWMCPKCKRIYVYEKANNEPIMIYTLES